MGVINDIASLVNQSIDVSISYFKENAVAIIALLFLWRYLRGGSTIDVSTTSVKCAWNSGLVVRK